MRVLVIEDEPKIGRALKKALTQESYAVDLASDGEEGLSMALSQPYDVAIVDRMLPSTDGLSIVKAMRDAKVHIPVLMLTALGSLSDRTSGLDGGADDYLVKPFAVEEVLARLRALTRRPPATHHTVLKIANLTLDTASHQVKRAGVRVELTGKEYALLEYLLRNQDRPVSKQMLIDHVWDFDADILPNTVEVYIKYLREKIDRNFEPKLIHTIRGVGYLLSEKGR